MNWKSIIAYEQQQQYYKNLKKILDKKYATTIVYPPKNKIFYAFGLCKWENLKVVIIGQDPYHQPNQAQGLAFSTPKDIKNPPSMVNILKEIKQDTNKDSICQDGDLTPWARQGVLLINSILTVEDSKPKSHHNIGWETFTANIIKYISEHKTQIIFLLWGSSAIAKSKLIDKNKHFILTAPHPSPLSAYRGFFGSKHFSITNNILKNINKKEIIW